MRTTKMAEWSVKPIWKKSIIEKNYYHKDGQQVVIETGWRWGEFTVYTDDDNPPNIEAGVDIYNCEYETELVETSDGCWEEVDTDDCDDETTAWIEEFFEEGNSWLDLEEQGWSQDECEMIIDCDLEITRLDGEEGQEPIITESQEETKESLQLKPTAKWPFDTSKEEE